MDWIAQLEDFNYEFERNRGYDQVEADTKAEEAALDEFRLLYETKNEEKKKKKQESRKSQSSYNIIPKFFVKTQEPSDAKLKVQKEARTRFLEKKAQELMTETELEELWDLIVRYQSQPRREEQRINYDAFCKIRDRAPSGARLYFKASVFLRFPRDQYGRINSMALFHYIMKKVNLTRIRISLTCYDEFGHGYLREQDLENYVFEQIPLLPQLSGLERDFYPYYVFTAVRYIVFFLDPQRKGKIKIKDLVNSPTMHEFNQLRMPQLPADSRGAGSRGGGVSGSGRLGRKQKKSWFSSQNALDVYAQYLALDTDHNGMLSKKEFSRYAGGTLTSVVLDRLFQEYRMYEFKETGEMEMDYKTFLDFVLAMEYKSTKQSLRFFWKILDLEHKGYLTVFDLNYFFRDVCKKMVKMGQEGVNVADVVANEIFDMVRPADPYKITFEDLAACKCGSTIINILTDVNGFWKYDNRELLLNDVVEEEEDLAY